MSVSTFDKTIPQKLGESWTIAFAAVGPTGAALNCTGASADFTIFVPGGDDIVSFDDPIWITQATGHGQFQIDPSDRFDTASPPQALPLEERVYGYRLRVILADGTILYQNAGDFTLEA